MTKKTPLILPQWIDVKTWEDYIEMRKHIRKPMTHRAKEMAIRKLERLMGEGENPTLVMEQSIFQSWQDLYPVKQTGRQSFNGRPSATDAVKATLRNFGLTN